MQVDVTRKGGAQEMRPVWVIRNDQRRRWDSGIAALATCPNVVVELGGLGMPLCGFGWNERATPPNSLELAEAMTPYYHSCIKQFGANRSYCDITRIDYHTVVA